MADSIKQLVEALQYLLTSYDLLLRVYAELGPHNQGKLEADTLQKLNDYFDFDDSE